MLASCNKRNIFLSLTFSSSFNRIYYSQSISSTGDRLNKCYKILGLTSDCTKEQLKSKYLQLAKQYHPDSSRSDSMDSEKFREVCDAYKYVVENDYSSKDKKDLLEDEQVAKVFDIRHTAPQHRQYLEYGGVGYGTPSQRQRQYQQHRVQEASENVNEYMVQKMVANKEDTALISKTPVEAEYAKKWKTRNAIDRLVEDLIQESMRKGEFNNLPGQGKPLKYDNHNPFLDATTHKLNEILIQNGFTPEWVLLEKEINQEKRIIRKLLHEKATKLPTNYNDWTMISQRKSWDEFVTELNIVCASLNKKIDNFNLVCPALSKQMVRFQLKREIDKLSIDSKLHTVENGKRRESSSDQELNSSSPDSNEDDDKRSNNFLKTFLQLYRS